MERFKNTQREYLYERIDNILLTITKTNKDYKELTNKYNKELKSFEQELSPSQLEKLDNVISLLNGRSAIEVDNVYKATVKNFLDYINEICNTL